METRLSGGRRPQWLHLTLGLVSLGLALFLVTMGVLSPVWYVWISGLALLIIAAFELDSFRKGRGRTA